VAAVATSVHSRDARIAWARRLLTICACDVCGDAMSCVALLALLACPGILGEVCGG